MTKFDNAFRAAPRIRFLLPADRTRHDIDAPLSIGFGQTNSQPSTVRWMLQWLDPQPGNRILDLGSGSGWTTALLAHLIEPAGTVYAVERIEELVEFGKENCRAMGVGNALFFKARTVLGLPESAPYDRILVSAAATEMPYPLLDQLNIGGRLVIPINNSIHVVDKIDNERYKQVEHPGFIFVPLIKP